MFDTYRLLDAAAAQELVLALQGMEWEQGRARTAAATGTIKRNEEIKISTPGARPFVDRVLTAITGHPRLCVEHGVKRSMPPKFNRYRPDTGGEYKRHGDAAVMGGVRTDIAMTLFLSHPSTYEGGELCIEAYDGGHHAVKGDPGCAIVYPCHMPHWVTPVTEGERICAVTWFESCYRRFDQRQLQRRLLRVLREMEADPALAYGHHYTSIGTIHSELQRMWVDHDMPLNRPAMQAPVAKHEEPREPVVDLAPAAG